MASTDLREYHPSRKFFEWCLWLHQKSTRLPKSKQLSRLKPGALKFVRTESERILIGPTAELFSLGLKQKPYPKVLNVRFRAILPGSLEIMYDPQIREFVEILSLLSSTPAEIAQEMRSLPYVREFSKTEIEGYLYFFWNQFSRDGWQIEKQNNLKTMLQKSALLSSKYSRHLRLGFGETSRLKVAIDLGMDCTPEIILGEAYRGFCAAVLQKNESISMSDSEAAESWSRVLLRDTQILRNMGWQPKSMELAEKIKVTQENPDFLKSVPK